MVLFDVVHFSGFTNVYQQFALRSRQNHRNHINKVQWYRDTELCLPWLSQKLSGLQVILTSSWPFSTKLWLCFCPFFTLICLLLTFFSSWSCSETILSLELRGKLLSFDLPIRQSSHNPVVYPLPLRLPVDIFLKLSLQGFVVWKWRFLKKMDESFRRKFEIIFTIAFQSSCMNFSQCEGFFQVLLSFLGKKRTCSF